MKKLTLQEVKDILVGCTILGTGGGGKLETGIDIAESDYAEGLAYIMMDFEEIKDEALFACPYFCGSIGPEERNDNYSKYQKSDELETVFSTKALERFLGKEINGIVSVEYGGSNTAVAMSTAARLGKPIVDGDAAGRAVPDLQYSTFYVTGKPIYPLAVADAIGDVAVLEKVVDDFRAEDMVRALAVVSGDKIGMTDHPCLGKDLKNSIIPHALSFAGRVGRAQRSANEQGKNPIDEIMAAGKGYRLFEGKVAMDSQWKNKAGFTIGTIDIQGMEGYKGKEAQIWFKNENIMFYIDGKARVTAPDLICVVEKNTGYPINNPFCKKNMEVTVLGFKAPHFWRQGKGLEILNPREFGFDIEYIPIEEQYE